MKEINFYLNRQTLQLTRTFGELLLEDKHFCWTLEDKDLGLHYGMSDEEIKQIKVYGETAVTTGRYKVILAYSNRFKRMMPYLMDVKGFSGILLHGGNTEADSHGCPLCAFTKDEAKGKVQGSAEKAIIAILLTAQKENNQVYITIN